LKRTIFYSWQSDLPNNTNNNLIEGALKFALKENNKPTSGTLELFLDKATREETGSPDITESIFLKISRSSVFVADISIIDQNSLRQTPNPNVLLELGYAARTLGWGKIILIFNENYGSLSNLPFDLRNRRIMKYNSSDRSKTEIKNQLSLEIKNALYLMNQKGILVDKILDFLKKEIDKEIIGILSHFIRVFYDDGKNNLFENIQDFLDLKEVDLVSKLKNKRILGFYLLKSFGEYEKKIREYVNQALSSQYYNRETLDSLISIYEWFSIYSNHRTRYFDKLFVKTEEKADNLFVIKGSEISHGNELEDRFLLMKKIDTEKNQIINFGDFFPGQIPHLIYFHTLNEEYLSEYISALQLLIVSINNWIDLTNKELIIDFVKSFRIRNAEGEWL